MAQLSSPILIGPLPTKGLVSGLALCFQILVDGWRGARGEPSVIDLTGEATVNQVSFGRVREYASIFRKVRQQCRRPRTVVYVTMAQSARGFARDAVIIELARRRRHDVVLHLNGGNFGQFYAKSSGWLKYLIRRQLRRVRTIIVVSERLRDMFSFDAEIARRVVVVPNALPEEPPADLPPKKLPTNGPIRILYLSNLIESKGYLEVLEVVRILVKDHSLPVRATFCGKFLANPSDDVRVKSAEHGEALFREFIAKHKLEESVQYLGQVSGERKRGALLDNHFLFLPTRYDNEAQPLSLIEALAYGLVPITTNYRANPDVVIDGITGHLIDWRDVAAMAHVCERYSRLPNEFAAISERARDHFKMEFSRAAHLKRLFELLEPSQ